MRSSKRNIISRLMGAALCVASICLAFSSCELIYEDLDPCEHGVSLRFVYDYNMEYANAFPKQVDCLTLYIYDEEGNYVDTKVVTGKELQDENYRMTLDLEEGNYHFVAYGGLACAESSFSVTQTPTQGSKQTDLRAKMDDDCLTVPARRKLHDMFWAALTLVNYDNDLLTNGQITYIPWAKGQAQTGVSIVGPDQVVPQPVEVAYAEFSTSRLMKKNSPRHEDGATVIDFPLNEYLLIMRSDRYDMGDQEYLDRESRWTLFFFLQNGIWLQTRIVVNDWVVRINNVEV